VYRRDLHPSDPAYEECDDGNESDDDECSVECISLGCGNGRINEGEACDDGNIEDADACRNDCSLAVCGDGVVRRDVQAGEANFEECDDANLVESDACTSGCTAARCGDGVERQDIAEGEEGAEACDDANEDENDACINCQLAICGDGFTRGDVAEGEAGFESCDDGNETDTDACRNSCQAAVCGDGVVRTDIAAGQAGHEQCDDGNQIEDDDCGNSCYPPGQGSEYRMTFPRGAVGAAQCNPWRSWRLALNANQNYTRIRFGREGSSELSCSGVNANRICQALRSAQTISVACGGHNWGVRGTCSSQAQFNGEPELFIDTTACSCAGRYSVRPCIHNSNWGGYNQGLCNGASQRLYVSCE
jgi:cysteine-rich repeat protein